MAFLERIEYQLLMGICSNSYFFTDFFIALGRYIPSVLAV